MFDQKIKSDVSSVNFQYAEQRSFSGKTYCYTFEQASEELSINVLMFNELQSV